MCNEHYDVIVIGGGPAGSLTAYRLAREGVRVLVLEATRFPRPKACGGGLQVRAIDSIPFDVSPVLRSSMRAVCLSYGLTNTHTRAHATPLVHGVLRSEFDDHLLCAARSAGAEVRDGVRALGFEIRGPDRLRVRTSAGDFTAEYLVGADGANSVVAALLNSRTDYFWQTAVYCELPPESFTGYAAEADCMRIDWGSLPSGYAWAFPKDGFLNIGAGGPRVLARSLRDYATRFAESTATIRRGSPLRFIGHNLPTMTASTTTARNNILLVGDAAGLVDPFTGDGITLACKSAAIAARCIQEALEAGIYDLSRYADQLRWCVAHELLWSRALLRFSAAFPKRVYNLFRHNEAAWRTFCGVLRGETSFEQLQREVFGPFQLASRLIEAFAAYREKKILEVGYSMAGEQSR